MKKFVVMFFLLTILCFPITSYAIVTNSSVDNVNLYFFYDDSCKDCDDAKKWIQEKLNEYSNIDIEYKKVDDNKELTDNIRKELKIKKDKLPLVVIGTNYFVGYNNKIKDNIIEALDSYQKSEDYCDGVSKIKNKENIKDCIKINEDIYKQKNGISLISIILTICLIGFFVGIYYIIKKKKLLNRLHR